MQIEAINSRALRFAETFAFVNPKLVRSIDASRQFVERFGTIGTTEYREIEVHMDFADHEKILRGSKVEEQNDVKIILDAGVDLLVVCSATDVIYHEFLRSDLD